MIHFPTKVNGNFKSMKYFREVLHFQKLAKKSKKVHALLLSKITKFVR